MKVYFWGVRGSLPTPLLPQQIQSKIMAAIQRITPSDITDEESRAKFIATLPSWIFGTTGGNTACIEIKNNDTEIILDAGTGISVLGKKGHLPKNKHYNLFISHFHWDHIQGFPFFDVAYDPNSSFDIYSAFDNTEEYLRKQMLPPYYPVTFDSFTKKIAFHKIKESSTITIDSISINACKMSHPGNSFSYSFECDGKKFVYATDVELKAKDFVKDEKTKPVFNNADCIILDSQYTVEEAYKKENWGHSAFCYAIDFAVFWNIKNVYLFHHEISYDDKKLNSILQAARWYAQYINHSDIKINLAIEGQEVTI
ncbi:MAG: MBL fold metallo-hydrolase [Treponema sp.]|nr:MBL fold metallo-hydrolase [Treponema sp.]